MQSEKTGFDKLNPKEKRELVANIEYEYRKKMEKLIKNKGNQ